jgi:protein O-GlcNAc transferase
MAILTMMGVTETIAGTGDEYVTLAVKLGKDAAWRKQISNKIMERKHLAFYDKKCIRGLEDFLRSVVEGKLERTTKHQ